ncbi:MAG TPA: carboxypeptidase regulatory-like domain-containing protein [Longimicrobiales bacterium]|nr:carboxypeptidase regulatory-like domain-containing protein [Longimicrobiales bacterium]
MPRRPTAVVGLLLLASLRYPAPAAAQTLVGRVVEARDGAGVPGAFVSLLDPAGRARIASLSDSAGRFVLRAPAPGSYRVRAERIGRESVTSAPLDLAADESRSITLTAPVAAIDLAPIQVSGKRRCVVHPGAGERTARVWEEARKALSIHSWSRQRPFRYTMVRTTRRLDPQTLLVRRETRDTSEGAGVRPFAAIALENLARDGYVTYDGNAWTYYGPDADVLLSDQFLDTHCLELRAGGPDHGELIGVAFRPVSTRGNPDIDGVMWLDRRSAELRAIEFGYTGLDRDLPLEKAGGRVEFQRLPSGAWLIKRWWVRAPAIGMTTSMTPLGTHRGYHVESLDETGGEIVRVDDAAESRPRGAIAGLVFDSVRGAPLAGASVFLSGTGYATTSDAAGRFRLDSIPPGTYALAFSHPRADSAPVYAAPATVAVDSAGEVRASLAIPGRASLREAVCPEQEPDQGIVFGQLEQVDPLVAPFRVAGLFEDFEVHPRMLAAHGTRLEVEVDAAGRYTLCGVPPDRRLTVQAFRTRPDGRRVLGGSAVVHLERGDILRLDLVAPK